MTLNERFVAKSDHAGLNGWHRVRLAITDVNLSVWQGARRRPCLPGTRPLSGLADRQLSVRIWRIPARPLFGRTWPEADRRLSGIKAAIADLRMTPSNELARERLSP